MASARGTRSGSPVKGKQPHLPLDLDAEEQRGSGGLDLSEDSEVATLKEQIRSLQNVQSRQQQQAQEQQERMVEQFERLTNLIQIAISPKNTTLSQSNTPDTEDRENVTPSSQQRETKRTTKVPDPQKLDNGVDPTFDRWATSIKGKFIVNHDHFQSEQAKMYYVWDRTQGDAQIHLFPRYQPDAPDPFSTVKEMIDCLREIYTDPNRVRDAKRQYQKLEMRYGQAFHEFKTEFLHLADKAHISRDDRFYDLYDKLTLGLQQQLLNQLDSYEGNLQLLCAKAGKIDAELKQINAKKTKMSRERATAKETTSSLSARTSGTFRSTSALPAVKLETDKSTSQALVNVKTVPTDATTFTSKGVTCFNCGKVGHCASSCLEPKRQSELKEIEEDDGEKSENDLA